MGIPYTQHDVASFDISCIGAGDPWTEARQIVEKEAGVCDYELIAQLGWRIMQERKKFKQQQQ